MNNFYLHHFYEISGPLCRDLSGSRLDHFSTENFISTSCPTVCGGSGLLNPRALILTKFNPNFFCLIQFFFSETKPQLRSQIFRFNGQLYQPPGSDGTQIFGRSFQFQISAPLLSHKDIFPSYVFDTFYTRSWELGWFDHYTFSSSTWLGFLFLTLAAIHRHFAGSSVFGISPFLSLQFSFFLLDHLRHTRIFALLTELKDSTSCHHSVTSDHRFVINARITIRNVLGQMTIHP